MLFCRKLLYPGGTRRYPQRDFRIHNTWRQNFDFRLALEPVSFDAQELGRTVCCYTLFDETGKFHAASFEAALSAILAVQEETLIIVNTPAHNPTGYTFTDEDWNALLTAVLKYPDKKIALLVDIAYLDFAGDGKTNRAFLKKLNGLPEHILPLIAFSASKGYTMYGMRCGAILCMAPSSAIAEEFKDVMQCRVESILVQRKQSS